MNETIHDLYIDSEAVGSYNNFDIHLPHPITVEDDEKAFIRLKDFQILNSFYNISNDLQNNLLSIIQTNRVYSRIPNGDPIPYFTHTNLFQTAGVNINKPILNSVNDGTLHTETLTPNTGDYTIMLYDPTITTTETVLPTNSKFSNIFRDGVADISTNFMTFNTTDYLVYYNKTTPTSSRYIYNLTFCITNVPVSPAPTETVYITMKIYSSVDGVVWVENIPDLGQSPTNGFNTSEWGGSAITKYRTFSVISSDTYQYHKVSFDVVGFTNPTTDFKARIRFRQLAFSRKAYVETITENITTFNHTVEDGAYSLTNLNLYLNYLLRQNISQNLTFSTSYPTQPFLNAQNKQILAWSSTIIDYYYKATDKTDENYKVEIVFNSVLKKMLGWTAGNLIIFKNDTSLEAPNYLNLINFKKIMITSSLKLTTKPYTFLNKTYTKATGIGDVIGWFSKDIPAFSYINWTNPTDSKIEIDDKVITKINLKLINEYAQVLTEMPSCCFHLQIIKLSKEKI